MDLWIFWLLFSLVVATIASSRERSAVGWFLLSIIVSPLLALILVLALGRKSAAGADGAPSPKTHVRCPDCRELVRMDARKCKHCGATLLPLN